MKYLDEHQSVFFRRKYQRARHRTMEVCNKYLQQIEPEQLHVSLKL